MKSAEDGLAELKQYVDSLIIVSNNNLIEVIGRRPLTEAFQAADNGVYIVNVSNASTSVIAPVETASCPGGFLVREDDSVPLFYSLDTGLYKKSSDPASPLARLRPALYEKYASYLGR